VHAHQGGRGGGWWVPTFWTDTRPGDTIRMDEDGPSRLIVDRDYPDSWVRNLRIIFRDGIARVGKTQQVEVWDTDGSVSRRVQDLRAGHPMSGNSGLRGTVGYGFLDGHPPTPAAAELVAKQDDVSADDDTATTDAPPEATP